MEKSADKTSARWLDFWALNGLFRKLCRLEIRTDALTWNRFCGALLLALLVLLFLSGAFMAFYYSPVPGAAYDSVDFAMFSLPFGDVIRGVHYYGWNLLLMVMGLHLLRGFVAGSYKAPRQAVWISGVLVLLLLPLLIITGDLLPWDQKGYWSTQVRLSIITSVPLIGDFLVRLLQGGPFTGIVALTRFYVLHILFLPAVLIAVVVLHLNLIGYHGLARRNSENQPPAQTVPLLPTMISRWLVLFVITSVALGLVAWYWPPPLGDPADPTDSTYVPKPEWWVLFLNQLVALFKGPLTVLGTTLIPGGMAALLVALPFLDRSAGRRLGQRKVVAVVAGSILLVFLILSVMGYLEHFGQPHAG